MVTRTPLMRALKIISLHVAVWVVYIAYAVLVYGYDVGLRNVLYETSVTFCISASIFYIHALYVLPRFAEKRRFGLYIAGVLLLLLYNFLLRYLFAFKIDPILFHRESSIQGYSVAKLALLFSWYWFTFMLFSTGYWLAGKLVRAERVAREKETLEAEKEKLQLENAALRAQINPHFLFNTLDSFRIESEDTFPEMARSINALIDILRSTLSKPEPDGLIPLEKEIRVVESLVNIYRRRFPGMFLHYDNNMPEDCSFRIPPHALLAFVENAFKHGTFNDRSKQLRIVLEVSAAGLQFHVYNKKNRRIKDESHGIGMKYITRQLENNYHNRYLLNIIDGKDDYTVNLKIAMP